MDDIIIEETFSCDTPDLIQDIAQKEFDNPELGHLKVATAHALATTEITELRSYEKIKPRLEYQLPHQYQGALKILRDLKGNALLADEVGLGKTITTGILLRECIDRGLVTRALILTPPSLVDQWVAELKEKFDLDFTIIEDAETWNHAPLAIASIDRVKQFDTKMREFRHKKAHEISWDLLIVDEAHKLKDKDTIRWKFVDAIQKKRFLILTATPFQNDLIELYNLLHLLKRGHLGTIKEFKSQFLQHGNKRKPLNPLELRKKLSEVMIRRKREETGIVYKKRIPKIVSVTLTELEYSIYQDICELLQRHYFLANGDPISGRLVVFSLLPKITSSSRSALETLRHIVEDQKYHPDTKFHAQQIIQKITANTKDSKIEALISIIQEILAKEQNPKILIYTKHPTTLHYIVEKLAPYNLKIVPFTGGFDREEKTEIIRQFKEDANILISTETGSEGLNFQFCHHLINYDLPWNPMSVEQRIGRLDRIGQQHDMYIYSLATKDTMEEKVVDLIINKMCCIGLVIGELPIILFNLGLDDTTEGGRAKIEEMLMHAFLDSKNNLLRFSEKVNHIETIIAEGITLYNQAKEKTNDIGQRVE